MIRGVFRIKPLDNVDIQGGIHTEKSRTVERADIGRMENCRRNITVAQNLPFSHNQSPSRTKISGDLMSCTQ